LIQSKLIVSFLFFITILPVISQNLVPNSGFELLNGKPRKSGEIDKAAPWISPTNGTAEIFISGTKNEEINVPKNPLGFQRPRSGDNYAGAILYDKKNTDLREYIQVELTEPIKTGRTYCVEFYVNIADLSKYSIDLIGAYFSEKAITGDHLGTLNVIPQILNQEGRVLSDTYDWEIICGEFIAVGDEKFITIGNFHTDKQLKIGKVKKPKEVTGAQNEYGYYFIDDVSVIEKSSKGCGCEKKMNGGIENKMNFVYSQVTGEDDIKLEPKEMIESKSVFFESSGARIAQLSQPDLAIIIRIMQEHPEFTIIVKGFAEETERATVPDLAEKRANAVKEYFVNAGIDEKRVSTQTKFPAVDATKLKNKRVDFTVLTE
jgi:outer membrane protein OmpA-like peptidoglycan-associated protein